MPCGAVVHRQGIEVSALFPAWGVSALNGTASKSTGVFAVQG